MAIPYTFSGQTGIIPLSELDSNFSSFASTTDATQGSSLVGYLPAGSGAVGITVQAKLRQTVSVKDFGAVGNGTTDDTAAVQAALNYVATVNGTLVFDCLCACASTLILTGASSVTLKGTAGSISTPISGLKYTGTGSGTFLSFTSCENIHLDTIAVTYSSGSFTGTLVAFNNSARMSLIKSTLSGLGASSALYLLDLQACITIECIRTRFTGAQKLVNGGTTSTTVGFTNCDFDTYSNTAIYRPTQAWSIVNCAFENRIDTTGRAITTESTDFVRGLTVSGCWMGDATSASAFTWIYLGKILGCNINGNYINGTGSLNSTVLTIAGASSGVVVTGNYFGSFLYGVNLGSNVTSYTILANSVTAGCTEVTGIVQQSSGFAQVATKLIQTGSSGFYIEYPTYGSTTNIDSSAGDNHSVLVTNTSAYFLNITNPSGSQSVSIKIVNSSGGTMGAITWNANIKLSAWTNPANGFSKTIDFTYNGAVWVEKSRTPSDVPN